MLGSCYFCRQQRLNRMILRTDPLVVGQSRSRLSHAFQTSMMSVSLLKATPQLQSAPIITHTHTSTYSLTIDKVLDGFQGFGEYQLLDILCRDIVRYRRSKTTN